MDISDGHLDCNLYQLETISADSNFTIFISDSV